MPLKGVFLFRFQVISHAGLLVENEHASLLCDPWLIGSCYWRSWWNFPEPPKELLDSLNPTAIYLTHLHWDHFHGPSLKRFSSDIKIYVPLCPGDRMIRDLKSLKFNNVEEIPHGATVDMGGGIKITSYQFGPMAPDSVLAISDGQTTLLNANDSKVFGLSLQQIKKDHPKVDFAFRSHSSANPVPYCIENYKENFTEHRPQEEYADEFTKFCISVGADYAIPFASNHCFLHKETEQYNQLSTDPALVENHFNNYVQEKNLDNKCVVMPSGSSWSSETGFDIIPFDYSKKEEHIARMKEKYKAKLEKQYEQENQTKAEFKSFQRYFKRMFKMMDKAVSKTLKGKYIFEIVDAERTHHWMLDFANKTTTEVSADTPADITIVMHAFVMNSCCRKRLFSTWAASKRLKIRVTPENLHYLNRLFSILDLYECDGLPLKNAFTSRQFKVRLSRWREGVSIMQYLWMTKTRKENFQVAQLWERN